jgi:hypothetical protein
MALYPRMTLRPVALADEPLLDVWDRQPHVIAATSDDPNQPKRAFFCREHLQHGVPNTETPSSAPCLQSLPQIFHQRVLSMTFRKTFNGGNDSVSELAIELWRLKAKCVERRIGTPSFPSLGLCH